MQLKMCVSSINDNEDKNNRILSENDTAFNEIESLLLMFPFNAHCMHRKQIRI